ncbi:MAG: heavy metal-associated domain-containing protein [Eubacteriales bacterium]|nr:heavy metal-associated domain-containing protein [Eubacteriales bacterium]
MVQITLGVDGMMCGMCESHINDAIRNAYKVDKVSSSRGKKQTVIISENEIPEAELVKTIQDTGYTCTSYKSEPYTKKKLFGMF